MTFVPSLSYNSQITSSDNLLFNNRIWNIDDVARFTGFAKGTIYNMTSRREIPHRKRGKKLFFIPDEIMNWIEES
ncbi:MAG: putative DNA-binding transcriptional regulator AlpA [Bacteriovoracaceae bacterium]|jgi:predicted DNA-binding transcriptional regulator AlpA